MTQQRISMIWNRVTSSVHVNTHTPQAANYSSRRPCTVGKQAVCSVVMDRLQYIGVALFLCYYCVSVS